MRPTQEDVARRANVSRALVSLVLRNAPNVSDRSRRKVLKAAEDLGYRPNAFARSLASKQVSTIGVLINDVTNTYFAGVYASFATAAEAAGYDLLLAPGLRSAAKEVSLVDTLLEHRVAGLALVSPMMATADLRRITEAWPSVVIGSDASVGNVDVVTSDEHQAAAAVIGRLRELGHRDIVHITGGRVRAARDRATAYRRVMKEAGLTPVEVRGTFTDQGGREAARAILELPRHPTAVVAANDLIAVGAMGVFRSSGLRVPEDISVVGYDDSQIASLELVQLTSVRQPVEKFGAEAVAMLTERIAGRRSGSVVQRLATTLVERATTGPALAR
jgi:DNA-binding LacI/PurR family transcriptional regulator